MDQATSFVFGGFAGVDNSQNSPPVGETRLTTGGVESATVRIAGEEITEAQFPLTMTRYVVPESAPVIGGVV